MSVCDVRTFGSLWDGLSVFLDAKRIIRGSFWPVFFFFVYFFLSWCEEFVIVSGDDSQAHFTSSGLFFFTILFSPSISCNMRLLACGQFSFGWRYIAILTIIGEHTLYRVTPMERTGHEIGTDRDHVCWVRLRLRLRRILPWLVIRCVQLVVVLYIFRFRLKPIYSSDKTMDKIQH